MKINEENKQCLWVVEVIMQHPWVRGRENEWVDTVKICYM